MKKFKYLLGIIIIALISLTSNLNAQPGSPPGDSTEVDGGPIGGNAPIETGIGILLALGAAYGGRKTYRLLKQENSDDL
jgi:hypothetical protein